MCCTAMRCDAPWMRVVGIAIFFLRVGVRVCVRPQSRVCRRSMLMQRDQCL